LDATDALAAAYCHSLQLGPIADAQKNHQQAKFPKAANKKGSWTAFLESNPDRKA
jgi:hypothetical protein